MRKRAFVIDKLYMFVVMKSFKHRRFMTAAIVIVVILGGAIIWYWWMRHTDNGFAADHDIASSTLQITDAPVSDTSKIAPPANRPRSDSKVVSTAQHLSGASQFIALFKSTGVADKLTGKGPYTIFVPTNGAFSQLPRATLSGMTAAQKLRFVQYHIIVGRAIDAQAQVTGTVQALSGDALNFSFGADRIPMVNSAIFIEKHTAGNGVVYLIDNVLLPPLR